MIAIDDHRIDSYRVSHDNNMESIQQQYCYYKLCLDIMLCKNDISLVTREAELMNFTRKSHNEHVIDFKLYFDDG